MYRNISTYFRGY